MIRKIIVRCAVGCLLLSGVVTFLVLLAGYLAFQQPAFYTELVAHQYTPAELQATQREWQATKTAVELWLAHDEPDRPPFKLRLSQSLINSQFAADGPKFVGDLRAPRIALRSDRLEVALQIAMSGTQCTLSSELMPSITDDGRLRLRVVSANLGRLPLPLETVLNLWSGKRVFVNQNVELDLTPPTAHVTVNLSRRPGRSASIGSVGCQDGALVLELLPPAAKDAPAELTMN